MVPEVVGVINPSTGSYATNNWFSLFVDRAMQPSTYIRYLDHGAKTNIPFKTHTLKYNIKIHID
jgi:hypothetical protein